jgi:hypothetical protein
LRHRLALKERELTQYTIDRNIRDRGLAQSVVVRGKLHGRLALEKRSAEIKAWNIAKWWCGRRSLHAFCFNVKSPKWRRSADDCGTI